jgi:hypothetical protein
MILASLCSCIGFFFSMLRTHQKRPTPASTFKPSDRTYLHRMIEKRTYSAHCVLRPHFPSRTLHTQPPMQPRELPPHAAPGDPITRRSSDLQRIDPTILAWSAAEIFSWRRPDLSRSPSVATRPGRCLPSVPPSPYMGELTSTAPHGSLAQRRI